MKYLYVRRKLCEDRNISSCHSFKSFYAPGAWKTSPVEGLHPADQLGNTKLRACPSMQRRSFMAMKGPAKG